jgi:2-dehydro-3-deoxyphosphogluconate aldolase/(4S)-4-hydroxy-2-oxoglutarate aldolase
MDDVLERIAGLGVVPVVVVDDVSQALLLADALVAGGLPVAEITFRTAAGRDAIAAVAARGDVLVGAGTVTTVQQVDQAVEAGARFIVSPGTSRLVVARAQELGVPVLPGVATASEIQAALELGVTTVKFFPASVAGGPAAITALSAPFANVRFVPTGGVSPSNLADYLAVPSVCAVGGSWMVKPELVRAGDIDEITRLVRATVAAVARVRRHP